LSAVIMAGEAQSISVVPRITEATDESRLVTLRGNTHPMAQAQFDRGPAPPSHPMERMQLVLTRSLQQASALQALLEAQQDKSSTNYHKWLTPEQFGAQFGPADQDVQAIMAWLQSHGFQVNPVAKGKTVIEFSGTAGQVRDAFRTEIHKFAVNGEEHWANSSDPQIPAALAPVVAGVATLHNFHPRPLVRLSAKWPKVTTKGGLRPAYNESDGSHALSPADYAVIYNINPLYKAGLDGTGVTIGVIGVAPILAQDIADFRKAMGLPKNPPQFLVNGTSPDYFQFNLQQSGPDVEGTLDVSWSGAIAPKATVKFVIAADTDTTSGLLLAEEYAVDSNLADIITESFSMCESEVTASQAQQLSAVREQAAAQGITYVVSAGDWGPYTCYDGSNLGPVTVNVLASSPYAVAVGGTEFSSATNSPTYWAVKNGAKTSASALSYIPEVVWNDSCDAAKCGVDNVMVLAGGGGVSKLFPKPSWQTGVGGIPNDGARDIPDLSLTASADTDPYLLCYWNSCTGGPITSNSFMPVGGTSASAPSFAGVMALVNQKMKSRQGLVNAILYRLAASQPYPKCDGSNVKTPPESTCVYNDITSGNNAVPGEPNYGLAGALYQAGAGYDLATGLGSVNVANLVNNWDLVSFNSTSTSLSLTPATLNHGASASIQSSVAPHSGGGTPTGNVALVTAGGAGYGFFPLVDGVMTSSIASLPGGTYTVQAHYSGDGQFDPSDSAPVSVMVAPEASTTTVGALPFYIPNAFYTSGTYGNVSVWLSAQVAGLSGQGTPSGKVTFTDNGAAISGGSGSVNAEGKAISTNSFIAFTPGQHSIVASYQGDASFQPSVSAPVAITITKAQTTVSVQPSLMQVPSGQTVSLTATIESGNGQAGNPETGTVTYFLNGHLLVKRPVIPNFDFSTGLSVGMALFNISTLPEGANTITATYGGDSNYIGSSSQPIVVNVGTQASACKVTNFSADPNPITVFDPPAATMINVTVPCQADVRAGSPGGALLGTGKGTFLAVPNTPVANGATFYLQSPGDLTAKGTLAKLIVSVQSGTAPCVVFSFSAAPSPIISATGIGATTITSVASCDFDVRIGSPNGNLLGATKQNVLISPTGNWVTNGMQFFLQEHGNKTASGTLATLTVPVVAPVAQ
jgi:subtilase family serine protease